MSEQYIQANGIQIAYEEFGAADDPVILLIMGLGTQLIAWPLRLCEGLVAHGFRVIRFDNRDIGLSEKMVKARVPKIVPLVLRSKFKLPLRVPYTLHDMADDAIGLLDALGIERAHLVGASMGGMITQIAGAKYGDRVLSLTSIMSTSGNPKLPQARKDIVSSMAKRSVGTEAPDLEGSIAFWRKIGSPGYAPTDKELETKILASYHRSNYPQGYGRHLAAIIATGSRVKLLKNINAPTLVIHGKDDPLVPVEGGIDTARHIQGSRLEVINGMGHDLPAALMPDFASMIGEHALAAQAGADDSPQAQVSV
jgi:pimeloyl-ACP methyl ester carboxylesterase